jgi:TetR/AcrR family transcriptional repressor of lmrAB and yxaGH operons
MATRGHTRQRLLDTAGRLFQRQGYNATGMNQILAEGNAPKGSMYFHFPGGKEQLAAEATTQAAADMGERMSAVLSAAHTPAEALRRVAGELAQQLVESDFRDGCPLATVALEAAATSPAVRHSCRDGYRSWIDRLADRLHVDGRTPAAAGELAMVIVAGLEGALLLAKVNRDVTPLNTVAGHLAALVDTSRKETS